MNDELERLRDVARAAAALIEADDESTAHMSGWPDRTDPPPVDEIKKWHQSEDLSRARRAELVAALARLAALKPQT